MAIRMGELRKLLGETIAVDFINEGFSFNKSEFSFQKKIEKNKVRCLFLFNTFSTQQEYFFTFKFTISEIQSELKKFWNYYSEEYIMPYSFSVNEGCLNPRVKAQPSKYRVSYANRVFEVEDCLLMIDETRNLIRNEFFKRMDIFTDLKRFQDYIIQNPREPVDLQLVWPALIAMLMHSREELNKFIHYLTKECQSIYLPDKKDLDWMTSRVLEYSEKS